MFSRVIMLSVFRGAEKRVQIYAISGKWFNLLRHNLKILIRSLKKYTKRWQEYTEELYKKDHDQDNHDGVITHLEPDILECEVKGVLRKHHYEQS